jgi:hypothetical protein
LSSFLQRVVGVQDSSSAAESSSTTESSAEDKRSLQKGNFIIFLSVLSVYTKLAVNYRM